MPQVFVFLFVAMLVALAIFAGGVARPASATVGTQSLPQSAASGPGTTGVVITVGSTAQSGSTAQGGAATSPQTQPPVAGSGGSQTTNQITDRPVIATGTNGTPIILIRYVVQPGDSLGAIAQRYRSSVDLILRQNGTAIPNPNQLTPGQVIYVPDP